jgi:hypothetical protein
MSALFQPAAGKPKSKDFPAAPDPERPIGILADFGFVLPELGDRAKLIA